MNLIADKGILDSIVTELNSVLGYPSEQTGTYGDPIKHPTKELYRLPVHPAYIDNFNAEDISRYGVDLLPSDWFVIPNLNKQ